MTTQDHAKENPMAKEIESVGTAFPKEQARVREVLASYREIGPAGFIGASLIEQALRRADRAQASGDIVAILRSYEELKIIE